MKLSYVRHYTCIMAFSLSFAMLVMLVFGVGESQSAQLDKVNTDSGMFRIGERIYREGVLPSGKTLPAKIKSESVLPGNIFTCVSCHLRGGFGSLEERVYAPPVAGIKLYAPSQILFKGVSQNPRNTVPVIRRPAYTDETLVKAIRTGIDPAGRKLNAQMPRYVIDDQDAAILINYLKLLSAKPSPGVFDAELVFATVISDEVSKAERDAMVVTLEKYVAQKNNLARYFKKSASAKSRLMAENMLDSKEMATRQIKLLQWNLKGAPETWRKQLDEYYRKEPVFALIGGIAKSDWKPVHQFSEENKIPCLFPNTLLPVISYSDWYTLYLSQGYFQEGEAVARFLSGKEDQIGQKKILQIVRDTAEVKALSTGFTQTWRDGGHQMPVTVKINQDEKLTGAKLEKLLSKEKPYALIIWDKTDVLPAVANLSGNGNRPSMLFISSRYIGADFWTLAESLRDMTYITYPYAFTPYTPNFLMGKPIIQPDINNTVKQSDVQYKNDVQITESLTIALTQILTTLLMDMKGNYNRDNFLDAAGMLMDQQYPLFGRISFGSTERYVSRGCYIGQLSHGSGPELIKKSYWDAY